MIKKIINFILRLILGATFIFSGYTKLIFIEPFELSFVEIGISNWYIVPFIARLFIGLEFILGTFIIFNFKSKLTLKIIIGLLIAFTAYLIVLYFKSGKDVDCGCFGEYLKLNPVESIIKNIILLIPSIYLLFYNNHFKWKFEKWIFIIGILIITSLPFIFNTIDIRVFVSENNESGKRELELSELGPFVFNGDTIKLNEGKKIVCFFSLTCKYCKLTARKLTVIKENFEGDLPVYYVLGGRLENLSKFWDETKSYTFPNIHIAPGKENDRMFFKLSGSSLPSIYFLENGFIKRRVHYTDLNENIIKEFLNK